MGPTLSLRGMAGVSPHCHKHLSTLVPTIARAVTCCLGVMCALSHGVKCGSSP